MAFCLDRFASIGTGWPMTVDEKDILTNLPASDEAFELSRPEQTPSLPDAMSPAGAGKLSAFGGIALMACLFGRNLVHLHRPDVDDRDHDLNGEFWKRHRQMDNILLNTSLCLPAHLKLPNGLGNPSIVFTNMCIHTSTICLHQAAIFKADKNRLPASVSSESKVRCITAANEIASIMRMISHLDLSAVRITNLDMAQQNTDPVAQMNPFISFCLYVSARVFVQYLKSRPDDSQTADSLRFLLSAMNALKRRNPLTESFLVQLDVDLEALGVRIPKLKTAFPRSSDSVSPPFTTQRMTHTVSLTRKKPGSPAHPALIARARGDSQGQPKRHGILSYNNECPFMKTSGDDNNPPNAPEIIDLDSGNPGPLAFSAAEQTTSLPTREPLRTPYMPPHGLVRPHFPGYGQPEMDTGSTNDMSGASPDGQSNRPTPNSSTASENRQNLTPGHMNGGSAGPSSFETSPAVSHQNLNMGGTTQSEVDRGVNAFFGDPSSFGIPSGVATGLTPGQRFSMPDPPPGPPGSAEFPVPSGWGEMPQQTNMTPVADGVLRSIMTMGAMDTMDLGWDPSS